MQGWASAKYKMPVGVSRHTESVAMRNKLKRSKKCQVTDPSKDRAQTDVTVLSGSSCSNDEASLERDSTLLVEDTDGSDATAGIITRQDQPPWEEKRCCAPDIKLAPIFLRARQHTWGKGRGKGELDQLLEKRTLLQKSLHTPQSSDLQLATSQQQLSPPTYPMCHLTDRKASILCSWRGPWSAPARHSCLEEIRASNPVFPARRVFHALQKKSSRDFISPAEKPSHPTSIQLPQDLSSEKRKRPNERDVSDKASKRRRPSLAAEEASEGHCPPPVQGGQGAGALPAEGRPRTSRLSRTHRLKQQRESGRLVGNHEMKPTSACHAESESLLSCHRLHRDSSVEDVLWTEKYSPQHPSEVIGNTASMKKLHSWLKKWKLRADCDKRRKELERKREENSNDSWDCGDFQGEAGLEEEREESLRNAMLISGPQGVGKTASVYACAQELGFKVFEVNCSSQRCGRQVLSQLKEATQSHLVETSGTDPLKPAYFNNYNTNSCSAKPDSLPGKSDSPKKVVCTSKKGQCRGRKGKPNPATVTLANFFKMKAKADNSPLGGLSSSEKPHSKTSRSPSPGSDQTVSRSKKTATSLILFEEVDVVFDDDVGFLAAIKTFMTTTKRPVILTTNDPSFRERFDGSLEEIIFRTPSAVNVCSYLQLLCLAENVRLELDDVTSLLRLSQGDVRRCLLQLQLWVHSGGGQAYLRAPLPGGPTDVHCSNVAEGEDSSDPHLPPCDTGCTASMLGLHTLTQQDLLDLLKCQSWTEPDMNKLLKFLAESWRRGVPLLYANLDFLLPLATRAQGAPTHNPDEVTSSGLQSELTAPNVHPQIQLDEAVDLRATTTDCNSVRNVSRLSRRKYHSRSSSDLTLKPHRTSLSAKGTDLRGQSSNDKTEQNAAKLAVHCLDALADFLDLMSYLNATTPAAEPLVSGPCRPEEFVWTGAEIKDGFLDETRAGEDGSCGQEGLSEIRAAVEGLGFHGCWRRVSEVWTEAQRRRQELGDERWGRLADRLTLPVSSHRQSLNFCFHPLCAPRVAQKRYELSRAVLGSRSFNLLGNRRAVCVDYMPVLRSVCRSAGARQPGQEPGRFLTDHGGVHLGLSKSTIHLLAEGFS